MSEMSNVIYKDKHYRSLISDDLFKSYQIKVSETDLYIRTDTYLSEEALQSVIKYRNFIEEYIKKRPDFLSSIRPLEEDNRAPEIVREMLKFSKEAGVGPMASVAGALSEFVGMELMKYSRNVIVENGGDVFIKTSEALRVGIFAAESPLSMKIAIRVLPENTPLGVCTSSASVGHSMSFGNADAVSVTSKSAILADAAATFIGNKVKKKGDIKRAIEDGLRIQGVMGVVVIAGDAMGVAGDITIEEA
jgi:ApbE superfamily uncharacterized protein (UPF0280 family)